MLRIRDIFLPLAHDVNQLPFMASQILHISTSEIAQLQLVRKSLDARKKDNIHYSYTVDVSLKTSEKHVLSHLRDKRVSVSSPYYYKIPKKLSAPAQRPVVVGFGPAGIFSALVLAKAGLCPIVLERGFDAATRKRLVEQFWQTGTLDPCCNVQFGEGGAGTFSDGKLNSGIGDKRTGWVLQQFVHAGAPENILYDAKPHMGTDVLFHVVQELRREICALGGEVRFGAQVTGLARSGDQLCGVVLRDGTRIPCTDLILAIGHSARDTFRMLEAAGIPMTPKPFSMGVRIEHRQSDIDLAQYGRAAGNPALPPADYKLSVHLPDGSSAYTFCMCPGGYVVAAASEPGELVTNGMSNLSRDGENANSALLVTLKPEDFPEPSALGGLEWQETLERLAWEAGGRDYFAPCQLVGDFLAGRCSTAFGSVKPTYRPGVRFCALSSFLPQRVTQTLCQAIPAFAQQLHGFDAPDAILTAPETRSSSPVRILRNTQLQASLNGLYPCGEGAGYAGGILSAAVDGMLCAEAVIHQYLSE